MFGAPAEVIQAWRDGQAVSNEIEVLECNLTTVSLYQACQLTYLTGMGGSACLGISMQEVRAALSCMRIKSTLWPELASGVLLMSRVAARTINAAG